MKRFPPSRRNTVTNVRARGGRIALELLEDRLAPDGSASLYLPPQYHLFDYDGYLTAPSTESPVAIAENYLRTHAADLSLVQADLDNYRITTNYLTDTTGATTLTFQQSMHDLPVANANFNITVANDGRLLSVGGGFVPNLAMWVGYGQPTPDLDASDAVVLAAEEFDLVLDGPPIYLTPPSNGTAVLSAPGASLDDITAQLEYVPTADGGVSLAWNLTLRTPDNAQWFNVSVDTVTGDMVRMVDYASNAAYEVYELPKENPFDGPRTIQIDPHIFTPGPAVVPSPFGWHDTNGVAGAEFTITRGNNTNTYADANNDNLPDAGSQPDGGPTLNFTGALVPIDLTQAPSTYRAASVTNLFYWNNILHDVHYLYGFNEASRNFQVNNYGRGGTGNDAVNAEAQDGGGTNNANFFTPPDGSQPRMQMYLGTNVTPNRDGSLDNMVVVHEYGHGVSNRLTGNGSGLGALQSGGMGEGWSDWWGLMFTQQTAGETTTSRGVGQWLFGQAANGPGIRAYPYDFDITNPNNETFLAFGTGAGQSTAVHWAGTRWSSALWDLNHLLIQKYGFEPNLYNSTSSAGNIRALHLVMNGLKIQPLNPSFIQARDAILMADTQLHGGANHLEIWTAFARRGLGQFASTASSGSSILTTSFVVPPGVGTLAVTSTAPAVGSTVVGTTPTQYVVNVSSAVNPATLQPTDFTVNGNPATSVAYVGATTTMTFTFATNPVTTQGIQTMAIAAGAFTRASDNNPVGAFTGTFRYDATLLQVSSTSPPTPGGVFTLSGPLTYDVTFNEAVTPASVQTTDLVVSGLAGATVSAVSVLPGNTTARFTISGITAEGTLNANIAAGAITDAFGNPGGAFSANYQVDFGTVPYPTPLVSENPPGSLIYDPSVSGIVNFAGDTDSFTLAVDPGQTISVILTPTSPGLQPRIELFNPNNVSMGFAVAPAPGQITGIQTALANVAGVYTFAVSGANGTVGGYTLQVILNAAFELEGRVVGATNNTLATAQNIAGSFIDLGTDTAARRGAVSGRVVAPTPPNLIVNGDFESGNFSGWTVSSIGLNGWAINNGTYDPASPATPLAPIAGRFDALTDPTGPALRTLTQSFVVPVGVTQATLSWSDRIQNFANAFQDPNQEFRVQIRNSAGTVLQTVFSTNPGDQLIQLGPNNRSFNITPLLQAFAGQTLQLRFEEQDSLFFFNVTLDNITLAVQTGTSNADPDLYSFNLAAGERTTLAIEATTGTGVNVELLDAGGNVLATGVSGATNVDRVISNFAAPATGVYYARVTTSATADYNLVVTQNAVFDTEANNSFATAQPLVGQGALGAVSSTTAPATNTVVPNANSNIEGDFNNGFPFHIGNFAIPSMRYQQIYAGSQFSSGGGLVDRILFRQDSSFGTTFNTSNINVRINLSYSATSPTQPSTIFASNVGAGVVTVFDGLLNLSSAGTGTPRPFDIIVDVANLFNYNPAQGNLLVDISMRNAPLTTFFDAVGTSQNVTSRIFSTDVNATTGQAFISGLVTRFEFAPASVADEDWYSVPVTNTANPVYFQTSTPADGVGQFVNTLNPRIELYNPSNVLVATGTPLADGRNEFLLHQPLVTGNYRVRVLGQSATRGEYFLSTNSAPAITNLSITSPIDEGDTAMLTGTFSDPNPLDTHTVVIDWGPGQGTTTLNLPAGVTTFSATHPYLDDDPTGTLSDVYPVSVVITDNLGLSDSDAISVTVNNVAPSAVTLNSGSVDENGTYTLTGMFDDPGTLDSHTVVISWGPGEGTTTLTLPTGARTFTATHQYLDDDPTGTLSDDYPISAIVTDDDGGTGTGTGTITVNNVAPSAVTINSGSIDENGTYTVTGSFADPGTLDTYTVVISWGLGEGSTTLTLGAGVLTFSASHQYLDDNPTGTLSDNYAISAVVTDDDGGSGTGTATVTVNNVAPVVGPIVGPSPSPGVRGQVLSFSGSFTDVGTLDTHQVSWDFGDGTVIPFHPSTDAGALTPTHVYTDAGTFTVSLTVRDDDTGTTTSSKSITIQVVALQPDPCLPGMTALVVGGSNTAGDTIRFSPVGNNGTIAVTINDVWMGNFQPTGRLIAFGQGGNDDIQAAGSIDLPTWFYGDAGNDRLKGARGLSLLMGGAGDDDLNSGNGRGVLIGGTGRDRLVGGSGDDLLIGGTTTHDGDEHALCDLLAIWGSSLSYSGRVAALSSLLNTSTVLDDGEADRLTGASGMDWFWAFASDTITDRKNGENNG